MNTLDFLTRVLPTEGFYCAIVINAPSAPQQAFFSTVEELATHCTRVDQAGNNTYYALSTFNARGNRKQVNVKLTKALFLDIDCAPEKVNQVDTGGNPVEDKGYLNQYQGLAALREFLLVTGLPNPLIVSSGRGLHVYWVLDKALPPLEWQPLADALKATYKANGFRFDPAVTADSARVLRPTGTHNDKNGAEVRVMLDAPVYSKQTLQNILGSVSPVGVPVPVTQAPRLVQSALAAALITTPDFPPSDPTLIYNQCKQVEWAVDNQAKVEEPLWYSLMGIAAHCIDPDNTAIAWSKDHPDYDQAHTLKKLRQWQAQTTGPTTCKKFHDHRPKGCDKCGFKDNIVTPCGLGVKHDTVIVADTDLPSGVDPMLKAPRPFKLTKVGIVRTQDGTDIEVCPFDIRPVGYGMDAHLGYETVRYKWNRPHMGWQNLVFRQAHLNDESREFATTISDQGIVLKSKKQTQGFQYMLRTYMDDLRKKRSMSDIHGSMGWKNERTQFVIGERLYKRAPDGTVDVETISLNASTGNVGKTMYSLAGSASEWAKASSILETADMPWHIFAVTNSLAGPLWALTGLNGITISLHGDTGGGKSIIQLMMQSIWGNPSKLHFSAKATHNALYSRLGTYCHLPMTIDEATYMDNVGDFCYTVTSGRDKARLSRSAVERDVREWATSVTVSTNISFASKMSSSGVEIDAQMARLLEVNIPMHKMFAKSSDAGRMIADFLQENHGWVGDAMAKAYLRLGDVELKRRIRETTKNFVALYGIKFVGSERFWETALVICHVAGIVAEEEKVIGFDFRLGIAHIVSKVQEMRDAIASTHISGFTLVRQYLNEIAADALSVMHTPNMSPSIDQTRVPRGEIKARFDVYRNAPLDKFDKGTVMIVRKNFRIWLAQSGYDYTKLLKEVAAVGADATPSTGRCVISRDTSLKGGQQYVMGINLCNPEMLGFLDDIQQSTANLTLGQMGVIK